MIDSESVVVADQGSDGVVVDAVVVPDGGGEGEQAWGDAGLQAGVKHPGNCGGSLARRLASGGGRILGYVETTEVSAGAVGSWRADGGGVGPSDRACGQGSGDHQRGAQEAGAPGRGRSRRAASPANHQRAGGASEPSS